ncbi:MAG: hypothetical protein K1X88_32330 [Nannocystaceae bacterium]|nr:hypothetical protein [Nannocystaceae bacterium]
MAMLVRFEPTNMDAKAYAEVLRRLESRGMGTPPGRIHHASYGDADALHVVDIWDTPENFGRFGEQLMPILAELGVQLGAPIIRALHNVIRGG